jgi:hypothetical protein
LFIAIRCLPQSPALVGLTRPAGCDLGDAPELAEWLAYTKRGFLKEAVCSHTAGSKGNLMDVQVKAGNLVRTIAEKKISHSVVELIAELVPEVVDLLWDYVSAAVSVAKQVHAEESLRSCVREFARKVVGWGMSSLEPEIEQMPGTVKQTGKNFCRLPDKSQRNSIVTLYGTVSFSRAHYRRGRDGKKIFSHELLLGLRSGRIGVQAGRHWTNEAFWAHDRIV